MPARYAHHTETPTPEHRRRSPQTQASSSAKPRASGGRTWRPRAAGTTHRRWWQPRRPGSGQAVAAAVPRGRALGSEGSDSARPTLTPPRRSRSGRSRSGSCHPDLPRQPDRRKSQTGSRCWRHSHTSQQAGASESGSAPPPAAEMAPACPPSLAAARQPKALHSRHPQTARCGTCVQAAACCQTHGAQDR